LSLGALDLKAPQRAPYLPHARQLASRAETKTPFPGLLQSPLTDSNRRPPPYHAIQTATGGSRRQRFVATSSRFQASGERNACHRLRPLCSITVPSQTAENARERSRTSPLYRPETTGVVFAARGTSPRRQVQRACRLWDGSFARHVCCADNASRGASCFPLAEKLPRPLIGLAHRALLGFLAADGEPRFRTGAAPEPARADQRVRGAGRIGRGHPPGRESVTCVAGRGWDREDSAAAAPDRRGVGHDRSVGVQGAITE